MVPSFSFASMDKCDSWSNNQLNYIPQRADILTQRSNLTPERANVVPKSLKTQSWFASHLSCFLPETSKLEFLPAWPGTAHPRRPRGSKSGREKGRDESFQVRART